MNDLEEGILKQPKQQIDLFEYIITAEKKGKNYHYTLEKEGRKLFQYMHKESPGMLNPTSQVVRGIVKKLSGTVTIRSEKEDMEIKLSNDKILDKLMQKLIWLDELLITYEENKEQFKYDIIAEEHEKRLDILSEQSDEFFEFLEEHNISLMDFVWFCSEWLSGGESKNTITGLFCHLSTYFKIKPVWFFALGKAGEGKSVIDEASLSLMPNEAILNGRVSEKALYRKSQKYGSNYIDGKILTMKDMGGKQDIEKWSETIDRYKELTTEGKAEFEVVGEGIDEETGERAILLFVLSGHPSVCLTTVNSESFDDQIMSRGVNVSPVATNEEVRKFHYYNKGKIKKQREFIIENYIPKLHAYINYIKEFYEGIEIINPYWTCLESWFRKSEYYKRALTLYPSLVETVCLLNHSFRETINVGDDLYLVATKEDNQIIADLFNPSQGISEPATRIFNLILKWYDTFDPDELTEYQSGELRIRECKSIFSVGEIRHRAGRVKSLKGLPYGDIMASLVNHGLIEAVDKEKRSNKNIYVLAHHEPLEHSAIEFDEKKIFKYIQDLEWMYGVSRTHLKKLIDQENSKKDSESVKSDLKLPPWKSSRPDQGRSRPLEAATVETQGRSRPQSDMSRPLKAANSTKNEQKPMTINDKSEDEKLIDSMTEKWEAFQ